MIRRHAALFQLVLAAADALVTLCVLLAASQLRFGAPWQGISTVDEGVPPALFGASFTAGWLATLWACGAYELRTRWTFGARARDAARATITFAALALATLFFLKLTDVSRLYLVVLFPLLGIATLGVRVASRAGVLVLRELGYATRYMLVLGANEDAEAFATMIEHHHELNIRVVGHLAADGAIRGSRPVLGHLEDLEIVLHTRIVDEVAVCLPADLEEFVQAAIRLCEQEGKVVRIPAAPVERAYASAAVEELDGLLIYSVVGTPDRLIGLALKRLIDVVASGVVLLALSPALLAAAAALRVSSPGPVLVRQQRVGFHGRPFALVRVAARERGGALARVLHATALDRMPELWNVLRGQMSLVGPRPPRPVDVAAYDAWHRRRLSMKPGLTGLWRLSTCRHPGLDHAVEADLEYIDRWSIWLDLKILLRLAPLAILGR